MNKMKVPLLDLKAQYQTIKEEVLLAVNDVLESQHFILGPKVVELEEKVAVYSDVPYAVGVSSGSDALLVALMALDIQPGDEVITTPFTFFSTAGVISRLNATPVFVDIDPVTYNIDPEKVESAVTRKTKAMIPVHLYGQCADMDHLIEIAKKHNIAIIEDAAQSIGAEYKGKKAGSMGDIGIFSFFPSKNLGGCGDGGMVVTQDESLYKKLKILRVHGSEPKYFHKYVGGNFRLDALQAAILIVKMKYLDDWSASRRKNAAYYNQKLEETGLIDRGLVQPPEAVYKNSGDKNHHIYNQYTIRVKDRDNLRDYLKKSDIGTEIYYPLPLHLQECFKDLGYLKGDFPEAEKASEEVLSLPIYPELKEEQKEYIIQKIFDFYK
jgi:dTDP-4-amino-4,6-dideoxygalactose transaminase